MSEEFERADNGNLDFRDHTINDLKGERKKQLQQISGSFL
jgi:hypothetical protein